MAFIGKYKTGNTIKVDFSHPAETDEDYELTFTPDEELIDMLENGDVPENHYNNLPDSEKQMLKQYNGKNDPDPYQSLRDVLDEAFKQASEGKGRIRHGGDKPFEQQMTVEIARQFNGFPEGQALKKIFESKRLDKDAAINELLGAIVYLAMAIIVKKESL